MKSNCEIDRSCRRLVKAFSLIEVTLALGIVSFAFVALLGILPAGLNHFTHSVDASTESQIAQTILTQARQAKFSELQTFASADQFNFDEQGNLLTSADKAQKVYFADTSKGDIKVYYKSTMEVGDEPKDDGYDAKKTAVAVVSITVRKVSESREKRVMVAYIANNGS
jgi:uncharacterized protein (TIGR02598 family)